MSEYRQYGLARLEQRYIAPGHWRIEGHDVRRNNWGGWTIRFGGERINGTMATLRACREFIYERTIEG